MDDNDLHKLEQYEIGSLLHGMLFAYERVLKSLFKDEFKHLTPYLIEELSKVLCREPDPIIDNELSLEENLDRLRYSLSIDDLFEQLTIEKVGESEYRVELKKCLYAASGIHEVLKMEEGICPIALIFATVLASLDKECPNIEIVSSEFTDLGSITVIKAKPLELEASCK